MVTYGGPNLAGNYPAMFGRFVDGGQARAIPAGGKQCTYYTNDTPLAATIDAISIPAPFQLWIAPGDFSCVEVHQDLPPCTAGTTLVAHTGACVSGISFPSGQQPHDFAGVMTFRLSATCTTASGAICGQVADLHPTAGDPVRVRWTTDPVYLTACQHSALVTSPHEWCQDLPA